MRSRVLTPRFADSINAANIACGFHASDPSTIHKTVLLAKKYNVDCGAHPGFPDIVGFGEQRGGCD